jgi:hypothetical protein
LLDSRNCYRISQSRASSSSANKSKQKFGQTSINSDELSKQDTKRKGFSVEQSCLRFAPQDAVISNSRFENVKNSKGKSQLFRALSCINKEINMKIDHKNQFKSPLNELNLDNFINKPSMSTSRLNNKLIDINDNVIQNISAFPRSSNTNTNKEQSGKSSRKQKGSKYVNKVKPTNNNNNNNNSNSNGNGIHTIVTSPLINDNDDNDVIIINKTKTNNNNEGNTLYNCNNNNNDNNDNSTYTSNFITFLNTDNNNLNDNFIDLPQELNNTTQLSPIESEYYLNDKNNIQYEILKLFNDNTCMNYTFSSTKDDTNMNNNYKLCLLKDIDIKKILSLYDQRYCELNKLKKENDRKKEELKVNYNRIDSINNRIIQLNNQLHDNDNETTSDNVVISNNNDHNNINREFKSIFRETLMTNNALKEENEQLQRKHSEMLFQKETLKQKYKEDLLQYENLIKTLLTNTNPTNNI